MHPTNVDFVERIGLIFEADGLPRIGGRMIGLLLLTPDEVSLDEMSEALQVSKASVSTNARLLERSEAIERVSRPGDRRDYYRISPGVQRRMMERELDRIRQLRDLMGEGAERVVTEHESVRARLRSQYELHDMIVELMENALSRLSGSCQENSEDTGTER